MCVWGDDCDTATFWRRLELTLGRTQLLTKVLKVVRVVQPTNGRIRFDIVVKGVFLAAILRKLFGWSARFAWFAREHVPYQDRVARRASQGRVERPLGENPQEGRPGVLENLTVVTYNINGARKKLTELQAMLDGSKVHVVALQETLQRAEDWPLRIPDFQVFSAVGDLGPSQRGLAIGVRRSVNAQTVGTASPDWLSVRIFGQSLASPMIFFCVYVPTSRHVADRASVITAIGSEVARLQAKFPDDDIVIMGDLNLTRAEAFTTIAAGMPGFAVLENSAETTRKKGKWVIDHFIVSRQYGSAPIVARSLTDWDMSDHYPVLARLPVFHKVPSVSGQRNPASSARRERIYVPREKAAEVATSNYWSVLADAWWLGDTDDDDSEEEWTGADLVDKRAKELTASCHQVADDSGLYNTAKARRPKLKKQIMRAIRKRRGVWRKVRDARPGELPAALETEYSEAVRKCQRAIRTDRRKRWHSRV